MRMQCSCLRLAGIQRVSLWEGHVLRYRCAFLRRLGANLTIVLIFMILGVMLALVNI